MFFLAETSGIDTCRKAATQLAKRPDPVFRLSAFASWHRNELLFSNLLLIDARSCLTRHCSIRPNRLVAGISPLP